MRTRPLERAGKVAARALESSLPQLWPTWRTFLGDVGITDLGILPVRMVVVRVARMASLTVAWISVYGSA